MGKSEAGSNSFLPPGHPMMALAASSWAGACGRFWTGALGGSWWGAVGPGRGGGLEFECPTQQSLSSQSRFSGWSCGHCQGAWKGCGCSGEFLGPKKGWVSMGEGLFPSSVSVLAESSRAENEELLFNKSLIFNAEVLRLREFRCLESFGAASKDANPKISVLHSCLCRANSGKG